MSGYDHYDTMLRVDNVFVACKNGNRATVERMLKDNHSFDINLVDGLRNNAFTYACMSGDTKLVNFLIHEFGSIDIAHTNQNSEGALQIAIRTNNVALVKLLMSSFNWNFDRRKKVNSKKLNATKSNLYEENLGLHPLLCACKYQDIRCFKTLQKKFTFAPTLVDDHGNTALHHAAGKNLQIFKFLLMNWTFDPRVANKAGETALNVLIRNGSDACIKMLLSVTSSFDINQKNEKGETPLLIACQENQKKIFIRLYKKFRDTINFSTKFGTDEDSLLMTAYRLDKYEIFKFLLDEDRCLSGISKDGLNPYVLSYQAIEESKEKYYELLQTKFSRHFQAGFLLAYKQRRSSLLERLPHGIVRDIASY